MRVIPIDYFEYSVDDEVRSFWLGGEGVDEYTALLLHMDGKDDSTTVTDSSASKVACTCSGDTKLKTATKKFGTASLYLPGGKSDYLSMAKSNAFNVGVGEFTIDFWMYPTDGTRREALFAGNTDVKFSPSIGWCWNTGKTINLHASDDSSSWNMWDCDAGCQGAIPLDVNNWNHIVVQRNEAGILTFINGMRDLKLPCDSLVEFIYTDETKNIGIWGSNPADVNKFTGYIDEFRITKTSRFPTTSFLPVCNNSFFVPTVPYGALTISVESTIKTQGDYSMKCVATTDAYLGELRRVVPLIQSRGLDLSRASCIKFDIRASRTGENISIGFLNMNEGALSITPDILSADTWQTVVWDISSFAEIDRSNIIQLIITVTNADSTNTFYIDNMYAVEEDTDIVNRFRDRTCYREPAQRTVL